MASCFVMPARSVVGTGALKQAEDYLKEYGRKALIVTGKHVAKSVMMEELKQTLSEIGIDFVIFDGITGEPTDTMVEEGVMIYQKENCDFCIGIGGGSPLDSAKAIAAMVVNPGKIADYNGKVIGGKLPPVVAIPTTAGTGSEATKFTIITDTRQNIKMLLKGDVLVPALAIVDPEFTVSGPKSITAATGLDALTHAVESYTSKKASPMTDTLALSAVKRIFTYLPGAYRNGEDRRAREEMSLAALEAGVCINNASVTIVHGMSRPIGALFHVPHGLSNAMLLKECLGFALDGALERFAALGRAVGAAGETDEDRKAAEKFMGALEELCRACEVPTLEEYGIKREEFFAVIDKMSQDAIASGSPANTIKEVNAGDVRAIYKRLWDE
ncbi:MAG: iron-containing alcohol dehydrogenase [Lachnospiraceae bacterium]|nr:iron-containing alcohol dehydrogenase [Lachnospiraceae bacterium]